jgi:hypothetical protein
MKKVLSLLVAFVFLQTQMWASSGGPDYGTTSGPTVGTYGGVLIPEIPETTDDGTIDPTVTPTSTAIGLFTLAVNSSGPALGASVVFIDGIAFNGNMVGILDPKGSKLSAILDSTSNFDVINVLPDGSTINSKIFAQGSVNAVVKDEFSFGIRITGTASLDIFSSLNENGTPDISRTVLFQVDGFQQSTTATTFTFDIPAGPDDTGA